MCSKNEVFYHHLLFLLLFVAIFLIISMKVQRVLQLDVILHDVVVISNVVFDQLKQLKDSVAALIGTFIWCIILVDLLSNLNVFKKALALLVSATCLDNPSLYVFRYYHPAA